MMGAIANSCAVALCSLVFYAILATYRHRSRINRLHKQGVDLPRGWSWIFGHLLALGSVSQKYPVDGLVTMPILELGGECKSDVFLLDLWPLFSPVLTTLSGNAASEVSTKYNFPKSVMTSRGMARITGGPDLVSMNGAEWKFWRTMFNPGFSTASMNAQIGVILDKVQGFCDILKQNAGSNMFCLDELTTKLTMDIIIKVSLDLDLNYQHSDNVLAHAHKTLLAWNSFWDPRILLHPLRPFVKAYYSRIMNKTIGERLEELFTALKADEQTSPFDGQKKRKSGDSVATLALKAYIEENESAGILKSTKLDPHFARYTTYQVRLFLFAGNDTTSSSISYFYHALFKYPKVLARMREEHDEVFGHDPSLAAAQIREDPTTLNKCQYTMAALKETLRLYPPAGGTREGPPGMTISDADGNAIPVDGCDIMMHHFAIHRDPRVWPRADEFLPERWLVSPGHELYADNTASYRPFEQGPRACIGQSLVYNEIRIIMVMTARSYRITPAYEEWDAIKASEEGWLANAMRSMGLVNEIKTIRGERAYQTDAPGAHPADGYPCHVDLI